MKNGSKAIPNHQLIEERLRHHWTQQEIADRIGTTSTNYSRWERGATSPGSHFRTQLCDLFGKSARELGLLQEGGESTRRADELYDPLIPLSQPLVGRESLLDMLQHPLCTSKDVALSALHGWPGVGKTALAVALASHQEGRQHFRDGILGARLGP